MITNITVKIKNSEQKYSHDFSVEDDIVISQESDKLKDMINTAIKCMNISQNALSESLDIEIRTKTLWQ